MIDLRFSKDELKENLIKMLGNKRIVSMSNVVKEDGMELNMSCRPSLKGYIVSCSRDGVQHKLEHRIKDHREALEALAKLLVQQGLVKMD